MYIALRNLLVFFFHGIRFNVFFIDRRKTESLVNKKKVLEFFSFNCSCLLFTCFFFSG